MSGKADLTKEEYENLLLSLNQTLKTCAEKQKEVQDALLKVLEIFNRIYPKAKTMIQDNRAYFKNDDTLCWVALT